MKRLLSSRNKARMLAQDLDMEKSTAGFFLSLDKDVKDILHKLDSDILSRLLHQLKLISLGKDEEGEDVDVHLYRSMIGCLMYLMLQTDIIRSTSGGCQYLGRRLVSWQCKKQTIVAISSTEAEYVAAASCCGQVLWMQNQLFDYGFNFMNTDIHIDNESTICIVKNPVFHSKTKHIQIRHHFIRDCYDQRLINVVKVQLFGSQYWNDEPIATFKGRTACQVWTLKEALMLFLRGGLDLKRCYLR
ncbi:hypothetical protein Tco_0364484 [Tanacetum coccineum]